MEDETITRALLVDGSLALAADAEAWPLVEGWMPRIPARPSAPGEARATIRIHRGRHSFPAPDGAPALDLRGVLGWIAADGEILLRGADGRVSARISPAAGTADVRLDPEGGDRETFDLEMFAALTLASAFLAGRLERTLVHAAAVVAPDGRAWLLAGGTFAGKTTTCLNLIRAGWDWLADDHVLLGRTGEGIAVEGWPRRFNLDRGYEGGASEGVRARVDPAGFGPGRWRPGAPLGGLLFPRVEADRSTALEPCHPARALARLLQQSPWLLADETAARPLLALLRDAARLPAYELRLGSDCYTDATRLRAVLDAAANPRDGAEEVLDQRVPLPYGKDLAEESRSVVRP